MFYKGICSVWPSLVVRRISERPVLLVIRPHKASVRPQEPGKDAPERLRQRPAPAPVTSSHRSPCRSRTSLDYSKQRCAEFATQTFVHLKTNCVPGWFVLLPRGPTALCVHPRAPPRGDPKVPARLRCGFPCFTVFPLFVKSFFMFKSLR